MPLDIKKCPTPIMFEEDTRRKDASMHVYSRCVAVSVVSRLVSAVWTFAAATVLKLLAKKSRFLFCFLQRITRLSLTLIYTIDIYVKKCLVFNLKCLVLL
ncbi:hypothetical protein MIMGU_mgv1a016952mg [Erythranthe guttata]|uniref:Uncharacterized protein n=1 Tax=Erythranthe guttata TaxID=4155 RepID=A0A022Q1E2_ERYGU|nr:hypothetical protein MIMGU_mgv1a016952mg [Erythranthe guttata]